MNAMIRRWGVVLTCGLMAGTTLSAPLYKEQVNYYDGVNIALKSDQTDYDNRVKHTLNQHDALDIYHNPFGYSQEYTDAESGMQYLRARYYNPAIKQFVSRDMMNLFNLYAYVNGNPIMNVGPSGHFAWAKVLLGVAALSGLLSVGLGVASTKVDNKEVKEALKWSAVGFGVVAAALGGMSYERSRGDKRLHDLGQRHLEAEFLANRNRVSQMAIGQRQRQAIADRNYMRGFDAGLNAHPNGYQAGYNAGVNRAKSYYLAKERRNYLNQIEQVRASRRLSQYEDTIMMGFSPNDVYRHNVIGHRDLPFSSRAAYRTENGGFICPHCRGNTNFQRLLFD